MIFPIMNANVVDPVKPCYRYLADIVYLAIEYFIYYVLDHLLARRLPVAHPLTHHPSCTYRGH